MKTPRHLRRLRLTRSHAILQLRHQLEQDSFPRLQMALIVGLTGLVGLLLSFALLHAGIDSMVLRYPLALGLAYLFFLALLWLWLRTKAEDYADIPDLSVGGSGLPSSDCPGASPTFSSGGGGDFGGGGATASFDEIGASGLPEVQASSLQKLGDSAGSSLDADELAVPLIVIAVVIGLALASFYVVYLAPSLLAELLFDGVLSFTLYRHLRGQDDNHWLGTAVRSTIVPFGITAVFLAAVGWGLAIHAPGARSVGEVLVHHHLQSAK